MEENKNVDTEEIVEEVKTELPINIKIDNFKKQLIEVINSSDIHISITEMILKDIYGEAKAVADRQLSIDMEKLK